MVGEKANTSTTFDWYLVIQSDVVSGVYWLLGLSVDPYSHIPRSGGAPHAVPAGPPHTTRRNHARYDGAAPPARHAGVRLPRPRAGFSSEDQERRKGGEAETKASDGQKQMRTDHLGMRKEQRVPGRQAERLCQRKVSQEEYVPGATDGSMPIGFAEIIYEIL